MRKALHPVVRLLSHLDTSGGPGACWPYMGFRRPTGERGYGRIGFQGKTVAAHRLAYMLMVDDIPEELDVLHTCDNPPCCNPTHLWLGTALDNMRDAVSKGRKPGFKGEAHGMAKLTEANVKAILVLRASGKTLQSIADQYGVTKELIWLIAKGKAWRHIPR